MSAFFAAGLSVPCAQAHDELQSEFVVATKTSLDFGLYKYFNISEKARFQLRMTATNFFNHPNFGNPRLDITSSNVGKITRLQGGRRDTLGAGPRVIQVGIRFDF